jgi:hypothetical protein
MRFVRIGVFLINLDNVTRVVDDNEFNNSINRHVAIGDGLSIYFDSEEQPPLQLRGVEAKALREYFMGYDKAEPLLSIPPNPTPGA